MLVRCALTNLYSRADHSELDNDRRIFHYEAELWRYSGSEERDCENYIGLY